ncbi:MAG TPA: sigma factor-like helix-turn-helix DNA-binding protein [Candidatus Krumholzibacteria bacterium]|nr:sigma factor-like helix-turn-helix DNA-binding protein [Candidatus Krumholzibacteria bacterium]HPD70673.1 sigma factor-like helix-turn-helix DNA-binding protein [Candidatus Krumholzibacteria bacterium]HRY39627.1 sigma factor-like helix-turn-helix DNA-binding protein [Candidatus Krumholzibacteria bacterium]
MDRDHVPHEPSEHAADLELAEAVLRGDVAAWHEFIETRSGVILAVLRRYLFDHDEVRTVYVDVLARLRRGQLATYEGRSKLTTWLTLVARGAAADHLRHRLGRRDEPPGLSALDERAREVYRLYYVEGIPYEDVRLRLRESGRLAPDESLAEILAGIEERLSDRTLRRIAWDLHAASVGAASGRLLEYAQAAQDDARRRHRETGPEAELLAAEAARTLARLRELVAELPGEERRVLELRFDHGWTADDIAVELGLDGRRRVYTIAERALNRLRRWLGGAAVLGFFS